MKKGWYGEVPSSEFITGDQLASLVGLTNGISVNSDTVWLKFSLDYKTLYVAKKPIRHGQSWNSLNNKGLVFGQTMVTVNNCQYRIRLLKGRGDGLTTAITNGYDTVPTHSSEWNRLMYHVAQNINNGTMTSEGITTGDWAKYTNVDLGIVGSYSEELCQDSSSTKVVIRATQRIAFIGSQSPNGISSGGTYWRPCLELVE